MRPLTISEKIIKKHLLEGSMDPGEQITVKLDQCLLQDATGTLAWLEYHVLKVPKVKPFVMQYVDHNMIQADHKNMDDHLFLKSITSKFGAHFSMPGNGISHHIHKERFTKPGQIMIGSDSHTPTSGGSGMIAIGTGGMDVAVGMATGKFTFKMPSIVGIKLIGALKPWCTAKDIILELLRRVDVDGGKGIIYEYFGPGVTTLSVEERSTIGNMGAETGATTSIFPSDKRTKEFFISQKRSKDYIALEADKGVQYDEIIEIDLTKVEPLIACPHSPGNVKPVREVAGLEVHQAMIGSSTNSSYRSLMTAAAMVAKKMTSRNTFFHVIPGSRQVLETISRDGGLMKLLKGGARIAEPSCNACIGMGNAPASETISIRSFPRNFKGRTGTKEDHVFLSSPETAVACAITGEITDPRDLKLKYPHIKNPKQFVIDDSMIIPPLCKGNICFGQIRLGPNIKKLEFHKKMADTMVGKVLLYGKDDISTDHILPAGSTILPLRSNIPAISEYMFYYHDPQFVERAKKEKGGFIVAGENYGQGSSREHAAVVPMHLGIKAVLVKSIARIHRANLINFGILPLEFAVKKDYKKIKQGDVLEIKNIKSLLKLGKDEILIKNKTQNKEILCKLTLNERERKIML